MVLRIPKPESQAMTSDSTAIKLNLQVTPKLQREGYIREMVRHIQNQRKESGFNVSDRIETQVEAGDELLLAIKENMVYLCEQTLTVGLVIGIEESEPTFSKEIDNHAFKFTIAKF